MSLKTCETYQKYLAIPVGDLDKPWTPQYCSKYCRKMLERLVQSEKRSLKFSNQCIWFNQQITLQTDVFGWWMLTRGGKEKIVLMYITVYIQDLQ